MPTIFLLICWVWVAQGLDKVVDAFGKGQPWAFVWARGGICPS